MNILVIAPHGMYQEYTASFVHNQARAYVQLGHRVRAVIPLAIGKRSNEGRRMGKPVEIFEKDGVEICYVRHLSLSNFGKRHFNVASLLAGLRWMYSQIFRDFQPDVIHANTIAFGGEIGAYLKRLTGAKLVITTHGGDTDEALDVYPAKAKDICDQADALVAVSDCYREKTARLNSATSVYCILNGFAAANITQQERVSHRITQVGFLTERKHAELTIQAVAALRKKYPDISLTLVGRGPEQLRFEQLCRQLQMEDHVAFLGYLSNAEALAEMAKAQIFSMPSVLEGFGIVYLEAMASGCVSIGTKGEGIDGVIVSGENGFLIPPLDVECLTETIDRCFRDEAMMRRIADAGRATAMTMTWDRNAAQYIELFQTLLNT